MRHQNSNTRKYTSSIFNGVNESCQASLTSDAVAAVGITWPGLSMRYVGTCDILLKK